MTSGHQRVSLWGTGGLLHLIVGGMRSNRFATGITVALTALSLALTLSTLSLRSQAKEAFLNGTGGYNAVLGARGSPLQLVLNSLFHLETSPGNIPWSLYRTIAAERGVKRAYPIAVGDSYRGFRVVGTVPELLSAPPATGPQPRVVEGRLFDPALREAVIGAEVARALPALRPASVFQPTHGLSEGGHSHGTEYLVVGVLAPTNSPIDRVIWIPLEGVWRMDGHLLRGDGQEYTPEAGVPIPDEAKEVSAVLLEFDSPQRGMSLAQRVNRLGRDATLAFPVAREIAQIFDRLGWAHQLLSLFAGVTVLVASGAILASLSVASELRRKDYALLRTLGLPRRSLFLLLAGEGALTTGVGAALAVPLSVALSWGASTWVRSATGLSLDIWSLPSEAPVLLMVAAVIGAMAGAVPGWRVYRQDLSQQLDPEGGYE